MLTKIHKHSILRATHFIVRRYMREGPNPESAHAQCGATLPAPAEKSNWEKFNCVIWSQTGGVGGTCTLEGLHGAFYTRPDRE